MAETIRLDARRDASAAQTLLADMLELLRTQQAVYLSTIDVDDYPDTRAMLNLRNPQIFPGLVPLFSEHDNDLMLLFTTNTSSIKYQQIERDSRASIYVCRPDQYHGLRLQGDLEIVKDRDYKRRVWQPGWEMYYPGGADSEDYAVLRMWPRIAKYYHALKLREVELPVGGDPI